MNKIPFVPHWGLKENYIKGFSAVKELNEPKKMVKKITKDPTTKYGTYSLDTQKDREYNLKSKALSLRIWHELGRLKSGHVYQKWFKDKMHEPLLTKSGKSPRERFYSLIYFREEIQHVEKKGMLERISNLGRSYCQEEKRELLFKKMEADERGRRGKPNYNTLITDEMRHEEREFHPMTPSGEPNPPSKVF